MGDRADDARAASYTAQDLMIVERDIGRLAKFTFDMGGTGDLLSLALSVPPWEDLHGCRAAELRLTNLVTTDAVADVLPPIPSPRPVAEPKSSRRRIASSAAVAQSSRRLRRRSRHKTAEARPDRRRRHGPGAVAAATGTQRQQCSLHGPRARFLRLPRTQKPWCQISRRCRHLPSSNLRFGVPPISTACCTSSKGGAHGLMVRRNVISDLRTRLSSQAVVLST